MRIPKTVRVGPHVYRIVKVSSSEMPDALGDSHFDTMEVRIRKNLKASKAKEILLHELLHCCTYPSFTGAYENDPKLDAEEFVNAVAPVLLQVLHDNPELIEYLSFDKLDSTRNSPTSKLPILSKPAEEHNNPVGKR